MTRLASLVLFIVCSLALGGTLIAAETAPAAGSTDATKALGDWQGSLDTGGPKLRLAVHLAKNNDGTLKATLDSVDQGAMGIPIDSATFADGKLRLDLAKIGASYEGTLAPDGTKITGTWTQGPTSLPLELSKGAVPAAPAAADAAPAVASDPIGPLWLGSLDTGTSVLRLVVHLARGEDRILKATIDSIDQGAKGLAADRAAFKDGTLTFEMKQLAVRFEGKANADRSQITGRWTQGGGSAPLTLKPIDKVPELGPRSQEQLAPHDYTEAEVTFVSRPHEVKLAGTLTLPRGDGPFPAVVLITGSGPEDRDEAVFGHRPFLVLADHLARRGIAVLRADDRGVGGSAAGPVNATSDDLAEDALAGVALLASRKEIDKARIGLIGHSEGGLIAPRAAARSKDVAFVVMLAGPGVTGAKILQAQRALIMQAAGAEKTEIDAAQARGARMYEIIAKEKDLAKAEALLRKEAQTVVPAPPPEAIDAEVKGMLSDWFRYFLTYDPAPTLAQVKVPLLALNGERDLQVPAAENIAAIRAALESSGHKDHTLMVMPGLNHLFQECKTGSPDEYAAIDQTIAPVALTTMSDWILARVKP